MCQLCRARGCSNFQHESGSVRGLTLAGSMDGIMLAAAMQGCQSIFQIPIVGSGHARSRSQALQNTQATI